MSTVVAAVQELIDRAVAPAPASALTLPETRGRELTANDRGCRPNLDAHALDEESVGMASVAPLLASRELSDIEAPDESLLVTEDDTPLDGILTEKQERLLTEPAYTSWSGPLPGEDGAPRPFAVLANVGLFSTPEEQPVVPDVMLSLDVSIPPELEEKKNRAYFLWRYGKPPEVVIEIVSNKKGGELDARRTRYERMRGRLLRRLRPAEAPRGRDPARVRAPRRQLRRAGASVVRARGPRASWSGRARSRASAAAGCAGAPATGRSSPPAPSAPSRRRPAPRRPRPAPRGEDPRRDGRGPRRAGEDPRRDSRGPRRQREGPPRASGQAPARAGR